MGSLQCVHSGEQPGLWSPVWLHLLPPASCQLPPRFRQHSVQAAASPAKRTTNLHSAPSQPPRAGSDTKKWLTTVFGGVPWRRMENAGQERPGTVAGVVRSTSQPRWRVYGTHPPGLPPPSALGLSSSAVGCLKLAWTPALRQSHHDGSGADAATWIRHFSMWQLSHLRDTTSQGYTGHRHVLKGAPGLGGLCYKTLGHESHHRYQIRARYFCLAENM